MRQMLAALLTLVAAGMLWGSAHAGAPVYDLIPRKVIFGNPERTAPFLSPDGTKIVFTAAVDGVMNVWVGPVDDLAAARPVTREKQRPIMKYMWARNSTHVLYMQDQGGNENFHIYAVDLATNTTKDLTPYKKVRAEIIDMSNERPDEILVGLNNRDERWHDAWLINVVTGKAKLVQQNDGFAYFLPDRNLNIRLGVKPTPDGGEEYFRLDDDGEWQRFATVGGDDALTTKPYVFMTSDKFYMFDSRGRDKSVLTLADLSTGKSTVVAESVKADINETLHDPVTREVLAYADEYERMVWKPLKPEIKADIEFLDKQVTGYWAMLSQSKDGNLWTLWIFNVGEPIKFGLYDRKKRSFKIMFGARPGLENTPLPRMHPHIIKARDGLELVSYLMLPNGVDANGDGLPDRPLPMVLNVHGGPWTRDSFANNPPAAWLANRGYAVLMVNFRGSTGFGKAFVNAGDREWGGKMHDDLIDAVDWAIENKVARMNKIAIYGTSYGGYAALVGLTRSRKKFACGVNVVGPSSLNTLLTNVPAYWASYLDTLKRRVGDPTTPEGRRLLREQSPLHAAARIARPLLLAHGANDPRTKQSEADQIVRALKRNRVPVTYALYADEGHGFARPENRLSFYAVTEAFLGQCLGGRVEPVGKDFEGSSISVPAGKEYIKGLAQALANP